MIRCDQSDFVCDVCWWVKKMPDPSSCQTEMFNPLMKTYIQLYWIVLNRLRMKMLIYGGRGVPIVISLRILISKWKYQNLNLKIKIRISKSKSEFQSQNPHFNDESYFQSYNLSFKVKISILIFLTRVKPRIGIGVMFCARSLNKNKR